MVLRGIEDDGEKDKDLFCERKKRRMNRRRKLKNFCVVEREDTMDRRKGFEQMLEEEEKRGKRRKGCKMM